MALLVPRCAAVTAQKLAFRYSATQKPFSALSGAYFDRLAENDSLRGTSDERCNSTVASAQPIRDIRLYDDAYRRSAENPDEFWGAAAEHLTWEKKWTKVLDDSNSPSTRWFVGGELNTCYNAIDRHVHRGFAEQTAIVHDSPVTDTITKLTYAELLKQVELFAGVLSKHGVAKGDRVLIYMPMIPEAVIAMLACARLGALHSLVFGGFASKELSTRINHAEPKVVVSANCAIEPGRVINYKPLLDKALELSDYKVPTCIIFNRQHEKFSDATMVVGRDKNYEEEMAGAHPHDCVAVSAMDPLYLLYTSGTTGMPKAVVRPSGGHAVVLNWSMYNVYGMQPHETWFAASDLGWVVGHSYIVYAPLLNCNTTVLFEGKPVGTPDPSAYYRIIRDHKVAGMFAAPTAIRAIRREDPDGDCGKDYNFSHFRSFFLAGEYCDHETMDYAKKHFRVPCLDNWWQTETGSAITSTCVGLGTDLHPPPGFAGRPVPGWNVKILRSEDHTEADIEELGNIVVKLPLPPSAFCTLWNNKDGFKDLYFSSFPGYYDTMDAGFRDKHGNIAITARIDDVINIAGHRLSTGQLEEAMLEHDSVAEAAVVAVPDKLKGHIPLGFYVLKHGVSVDEDQLEKEIVLAVREHVGPVASFRSAIAINKLPKTRSGKVARHTIASMITRKPFSIPVTIEDASVYDNLEEVLRKKGYNPLPPS